MARRKIHSRVSFLGPSVDLHLDLAAAPGPSLRQRAENALRDAIRRGALPAGHRLPSTRDLSVQLGVSRGVLVDAYAQLAAEGYVRTRRGGGTMVASGIGPAPSPVRSSPRAPAARYDLRPAVPALSAFPRAAWLASLSRVLRHVPDRRLGYEEPGGTQELREVLAAYLGRVRAVEASPEQVLVTSGLRHGLGVLWPVLRDRGVDAVAVEDPRWSGVDDTLLAAGLEAVPVPVDGGGLRTERLDGVRAGAVIVTPAHQYPTGVVLGAARRTALIAWARERGAIVLEDDYDAEFRYDRAPVGSLQGTAPEHVVYGGSASKILAPVMRLGWLVAPAGLVGELRARQALAGGVPSTLSQLALADLVERGELDRHLRRQRRRYRAQRDALLEAAAELLPELRPEGAAAGLHVVLRLPPGADADDVARAAARAGVAVDPLEGPRPALLVGYANVPAESVRPALSALARALRDHTTRESA